MSQRNDEKKPGRAFRLHSTIALRWGLGFNPIVHFSAVKYLGDSRRFFSEDAAGNAGLERASWHAFLVQKSHSVSVSSIL